MAGPSEGSTTSAANGTADASSAKENGPSDIAHRTRGVLGKRERLKENSASPPPEHDIDVAAERAKFARSLDKIQASLKKKLAEVEASISKQEEDYIVSTWSSGNIMRGWDAVRKVDRPNKASGNGSGTATGAPKHRKPRPSDRLFSMSSDTSKLRREGADLKKQANQKKKKKR